MKSEQSFFRKGVDNQKKSDLKINLSRPPVEDIKNWTDEEKAAALKWLSRVNKVYNAFKSELITGLLPEGTTLTTLP